MIWNPRVLLPCSPLDEEHNDVEQTYFGEENFCDANNQNNLILADDENRFLDTYGGSGNPQDPLGMIQEITEIN